MIKVISIDSQASVPVAEGHVRTILGPSDEGTRVQVAREEVNPGQTCRLAASDRTQVAYILEGQDAKVVQTTAKGTAEHTAQRRAGVYLEPGEAATVTASATPLLMLLITVPKHTGKATGGEAPVGYFFDVMTHGFGAMQDYAAQVPVADRWAIAAYIRALQLSQRASVDDVPADRRADLDRAPAAGAGREQPQEAH